jgi:hypothetical protein
MPEKSNSNKKTIEVKFIPNISSLVKINSINIEISRIKYNNDLGFVFSSSNGVEDVNTMITSNAYSILLSGKNNATHQWKSSSRIGEPFP